MPFTPENEIPGNPYANLIAPALVGGALGLLFGRGMERRSANVAALALLATGALVAAPTITDIVLAVRNRPTSARGSRRRLEGIRDGALPDTDVEGFFIDDLPVTTR